MSKFEVAVLSWLAGCLIGYVAAFAELWWSYQRTDRNERLQQSADFQEVDHD